MSMTYLQFLLLFVVLPSAVMLLLIRRSLTVQSGSAPHSERGLIPPEAFVKAALVLVVLAVVYTTPWDNYLVKHKIWWYGLDRVLATIGYVPVEEYAFFVLQTIMTCLWGYSCYRARALGGSNQLAGSVDSGVLIRAHNERPWPLSLLAEPAEAATDCWPMGTAPTRASTKTSAFYGVLALYLAAFAIGLYGLLIGPDSWRYLGLILSWAMPIALLQWWLGGEHLLANSGFSALMFWPPTLYLWAADAFAIHAEIWTISERFTLGLKAGPLPLEEAVFFAVTNLMVTQGLILFVLLLPFGQHAPIEEEEDARCLGHG